MKTKLKKESIKQRRIFSESVRKQVVKDVEDGKCSVIEASREIGASRSIIYTWIFKYSRYLKQNKLLVVEEKSEAYRTKELEKRIKELEAALGRKALEAEYLHKLIEVASENLDVDLKKNFVDKLSTGSIPLKKGKGIK